MLKTIFIFRIWIPNIDFTLAMVMHFDFVSAAQILVDDWGLKLDLLDKHRKILAKFCQTQA